MLFLDYVYYLCCRYYKRNKSERDSDSWYASGIILSGGFTICFSLAIWMIIENLIGLSHTNTMEVAIGGGVFFLFYIIRYNKLTNYDEIKDKIITFSDQKRKRYNIAACGFMILSFVGTILVVIFLAPLHN